MNEQAHSAYRNAQSILKNHGLTVYRFHKTWSDLNLLEYSLDKIKVRLYRDLASISATHGAEAGDAIEEEMCKAFAHVVIGAIPDCARKYAAEILVGAQDED